MKKCSDMEYFIATLKHAKSTDFTDNVLTLTFGMQQIASYFKHRYRKTFEKTASEIFNRKIYVEVESE